MESPSRIVLGIVAACVLLTMLVLFRSSGDDKEVAAPRPGSMTSQSAKPRPNQFARSDGYSRDSNFGSDEMPKPRNLPSSGMEPVRPSSAANVEGQHGGAPPDSKSLEPASGATGRNLAAEPVPAA